MYIFNENAMTKDNILMHLADLLSSPPHLFYSEVHSQLVCKHNRLTDFTIITNRT